MPVAAMKSRSRSATALALRRALRRAKPRAQQSWIVARCRWAAPTRCPSRHSRLSAERMHKRSGCRARSGVASMRQSRSSRRSNYTSLRAYFVQPRTSAGRYALRHVRKGVVHGKSAQGRCPKSGRKGQAGRIENRQEGGLGCGQSALGGETEAPQAQNFQVASLAKGPLGNRRLFAYRRPRLSECCRRRRSV